MPRTRRTGANSGRVEEVSPLDLLTMTRLAEEVEAMVARAGTHPVWGHAHCLRVYALAEELAAVERLSHDPEVLRLSALLHDIGLYKAYNLREAADHAQRSAAVAERLLRDADFPPQATRAVKEAIKRHPPGAPPGGTVEATLLKDAVALDYLGAVGISRVMAMVGLEEDVPDLPSAVRHSQSLHRNIPDLLLLGSSREIAREREYEAREFFHGLESSTANLKLL
jgi:uncharacterized protein